MRYLWLIPILFLLSCTNFNVEEKESWLYQLQNINIDDIASTKFDVVVIDYSSDGTEDGEFSKEDIEKIKSSGKKVLAYLSIGEAEDYRFYWKDEWDENPPEWLGNENPEWEGNYAVRYWMDGWKEVLDEYISRIESQGFDGLYLDKVDEFEYWADPENGEDEYYDEETTAASMIDLIAWISERFDGLIFIQNGERIVEYDNGRLMDSIDGIAIEDLFYIGTEMASDEWISERLGYINQFIENGKECLSVDYVDDGSDSQENIERIEDYIKRARDNGCIPYAAMSDRELDEIVIIGGIQP